jgi:hypothetical protein
MSEAMDPQAPQNPGDPIGSSYPYGYVQRGDPTNAMGADTRTSAQSDPLAAEPPGLITFAAVMVFTLGGFQIVWAIVEFLNAAWLAGTAYGTFNGHLWLWGILDTIVGLAAIYAGYDILRGGAFGRIFGLIVAGVTAIRWFFYLPAAPILGIVMIAIAVIVVYALVSHGEFYASSSPR